MGAQGLEAHLSGGCGDRAKCHNRKGDRKGDRRCDGCEGSQGDVLPSIAHFIFKGCKQRFCFRFWICMVFVHQEVQPVQAGLLQQVMCYWPVA